MKWFQSQSIYLQIAAPLLVVLALVAAFLISTGGGPKFTTIKVSSSKEQVDGWVWRLDQDGVKSRLTYNDKTGEYEVKVAVADEAEANLALGGSSLKERASTSTTKSCPALKAIPNRQVGLERAKCMIEAQIHDQLMSNPAILEAKVTYDEATDSSITGVKPMRVNVVLFLNKDENGEIEGNVDAAELAGMVANSRAGLTPDNVYITSSDDGVMWAGKKGAISGSSSAMTGCQDSADITDISTKERLNSDCTESRILKTIAPIAGGEQFVQVVAHFGLNDTSMSKQTVRNSKGAPTTEDSFGGNAGSKTNSLNTTTVNEQRAAGSMRAMRVSVLLDSQHVKTGQKLAIEQALTNYVDDPRNLTVVFADFAGGLKDADKPNAMAAANGGAGDPVTGTEEAAPTTQKDTTATSDTVPVTSESSIPPTVLILGFFLLVGLITTIVLLWRRSAHLAKERQAFEHEFRSEMGAFSSMAEQDPASIAAQLEAMLGQPSQAAPRQGEELTPR